MHKSKLVKLLKTLTKGEVKSFHRFLKSPYHNTNGTLVKLYKNLIAYQPDFVSKKLEKKEVAQKMYQASDQNTLAVLQKDMSKLTLLLEQFFLNENLKKRPILSEYLLTEALADRGMHEEYEKLVLHLLQTLADLPNPNEFHFFLYTRLNEALYFHPETNKSVLDIPFLADASTYLEKTYWLIKTRILMEQLVRRNIFIELDETLSISQAQSAIYYYPEPIFLVYSKLLALYQESSQLEFFSEILRDIRSMNAFLNDFDKGFILNSLVNYATKNTELGYQEYFPQMVEIYRFAEENQLLVEKNGIAPINFLNIVRVFASIQDFEWVDRFIHVYQNYLTPSIRKDIVALAWANRHFYAGENGRALDFIGKVKESQFQLKIQSEMLAIRIFLQLYLQDPSYQSILETRINNFKKYLHRDTTLAAEKKAALRNFTTITDKIARCSHDPTIDVATLQKLIKEIELKTPLTGIKWLMEIVQQLLKSKEKLGTLLYMIGML